MTLLIPSVLLLGLLALPILLLYMLKLRRRQVNISSIMLWQMLLRDRQANTPWQKLRRNLLLFLQLLILAALVLAVARPAIPVASITTGSLVVLMDASASMNVVEDSATRFEMAREAIRALIHDLGSGETLTLIHVGKQPVILAASEMDKDQLYETLDQAAVTQGIADWQAALALAAGAASQAGPNSTILIVSDGGMPKTGLPALPGKIRFLPIGTSEENLAFTALSLRPSGTGAELFASVKNFSQTDQEILISLYENNDLLEVRSFQISAGDEKSLTIGNLPTTQGIYFARLTLVDEPLPGASTKKFLDSFSLDNTAFAVNQPQRSGNVLLVSRGNIFLEQVLAALPTITPFRFKPEDNSPLQLPQENFDCYIFDGTMPENLTGGNLLLINPPSNSLFQVLGSFAPGETPQVLSHQLTEYLDWSNIHIAQAKQVQVPYWADVLVEVDDQPIVFVGETGGRRLAVLMFDLHDSDLPLQVAFPILFANLIDYLVPSRSFEAQDGLLPGDTLIIRTQPAVEEVVVVSPSGKIFSYPPSSNGILFTETDELGLYAVNFIQNDKQSAEYFAVNLFDARESDIQPQTSLNIGRSTIQGSATDQHSLREFWPWLAALALSILVLEWWVYHRPGHLGRSL